MDGMQTFSAALNSRSSSSQSQFRSTVRHAYAPSSISRTTPAATPRSVPRPALPLPPFSSPPELTACPAV